METFDRSSTLATAVLEFRDMRKDYFPADLFGEPAWDLLLALFVADAKGQRLTAREVCGRGSASHSVMSRWLRHLSALGLVIGDGDGDLDDLLTLSPTALGSMERAMDRVIDVHAKVIEAFTEAAQERKANQI